MFYCCWNTSYCDYPCQLEHWPQHQLTCAQTMNTETRDSARRQQSSLRTNQQVYQTVKQSNDYIVCDHVIAVVRNLLTASEFALLYSSQTLFSTKHEGNGTLSLSAFVEVFYTNASWLPVTV